MRGPTSTPAEGDTVTSRLRTAVPAAVPALALAALLLGGCTGGEPSDGAPTPGATDPAPSATASPTASPTASADPSDTADPPATPAPDEQELLDQVREDGTLSVIVELAVADADAGPAERSRLIEAAQDDLVDELDPEHAQVTTRFQRNPQMTLTVDEDGLRALYASSRVTHVWENGIVRVH